jgi:hypothetical protein
MSSSLLVPVPLPVNQHECVLGLYILSIATMLAFCFLWKTRCACLCAPNGWFPCYVTDCSTYPSVSCRHYPFILLSKYYYIHGIVYDSSSIRLEQLALLHCVLLAPLSLFISKQAEPWQLGVVEVWFQFPSHIYLVVCDITLFYLTVDFAPCLARAFVSCMLYR